MSVNAISQAMSGALWGINSSNLPENIVQKLLELGYNPNDVSSITEARDLIEKSENSIQNGNKNNSRNQEQNEDSKDNPALFLRAKNLAQKIGIKPDENGTLDDLLSKISNAVDNIMKRAVDTEDRALFERAKGFQFELDSIEADANGSLVSNNVVYSWMDMMAYNNKFLHNLN